MLTYAWPGNVRELRNAIEQTILMASADVVQPLHLPFCRTLAMAQHEVLAHAPAEPTALPVSAPEAQNFSLLEVERSLLAQALQRTAGNVTRAAKLLGLSRDTLRYRMGKYRITYRV